VILNQNYKPTTKYLVEGKQDQAMQMLQEQMRANEGKGNAARKLQGGLNEARESAGGNLVSRISEGLSNMFKGVFGKLTGMRQEAQGQNPGGEQKNAAVGAIEKLGVNFGNMIAEKFSWLTSMFTRK
jgi:hypothetical protein